MGAKRIEAEAGVSPKTLGQLSDQERRVSEGQSPVLRRANGVQHGVR